MWGMSLSHTTEWKVSHKDRRAASFTCSGQLLGDMKSFIFVYFEIQLKLNYRIANIQNIQQSTKYRRISELEALNTIMPCSII